MLAQALSLPCDSVAMATMYVIVSSCMSAGNSCVDALVNHVPVIGTEETDFKGCWTSESAVVLPSAAVTPTSVPVSGFPPDMRSESERDDSRSKRMNSEGHMTKPITHSAALLSC